MLLKLRDSDTIAAIATPLGEGGISVIRISGSEAFSIGDKVFMGKGWLQDGISHTAHFGKMVDREGKYVDEVVATIYRAPNSYTGEDVVEFGCHGGYLVTQKALTAVITAGARNAEPGEFTKRAFLNGKMDLSQAEAVGDLIHSRSEAAYRSSVRQLSGELSRELKGIRDELLNLASLLELELDFSEEDVEFANRQLLRDRLEKAGESLDRLLKSYSVGKVYREGVFVTITGKPNVGKSSLLNALLQEDRAIVSAIPGTTRDTITESISIDGVLFRLTDTAGLRETTDSIERLGVERAEKEASEADVILLVMDYGERDHNGTEPIYDQLKFACKAKGVKLAKVWNKIDLYKTQSPRSPNRATEFYISALTGEGVESIKHGLSRMMLSEGINEGSVVVTNARHEGALRRARESLGLALRTLGEGKSGEFVALDLRSGLNAMGEITGEVTTDDILNNIFSKFCIGK